MNYKLQALITHNPFKPWDEHRELVSLENQRLSIAEIVSQLGIDTRRPFVVMHNGVYILRGDHLGNWLRLRPKTGVVHICYLPAGGGGGGSNPLRAILTIALIVFVPQMAAALGGMIGMTGAPMLGMLKAGIMMLGSAIIQNVGPNPQPANQGVYDMKAASPTYSLNANGNTIRLGQAIPVVYGEMRVYPDFAAIPWSWYDNSNSDQYLLQVFVVSYGKRLIDKVQLDDSRIESFEGAIWAAAYFRQSDGAQTWTGGSHNLATIANTFPSGCEKMVTAAEVSGQELDSEWTGGFVVNPSGTTISIIEYDVICPRGLYYANDDGSFAAKSVEWSLEYREIDGEGNALGSWLAVNVTRQESRVATKEGALIPAFSETGNYAGYDYGNTRVARSGTIYIDLGVKGAANLSVQPVVVGATSYGGKFMSSGFSCIVNSHSIDTSGTTDIAVVNITTVEGSVWNQIGYENGGTRQEFANAVTVSYHYTVTVPAQSGYLSAATNNPLRRTYRFAVPPARYEVRMKRVDTKDTSSRVGHDLLWGGLKGSVVANPDWKDITVVYMRLKATQGLSGSVTRKLNCLAKAQIPVPWRSNAIDNKFTPAIAIYDALTNWYGGALPAANVDTASLRALDDYCIANQWRFDGVIDNQQPAWDVIKKMAAVGCAEPVQQGKIIRFVIDKPRTLPVMGFRPDNIVKGSVNVKYVLATSDTVTDMVIMYRNRRTWRDTSYPEYSPNHKTATIEGFGVTTANHATDMVAYYQNKNRFRRKQITFATELEGMLVTKGDYITITHDLLTRSQVWTLKRLITPAQVGQTGNWRLLDFEEGELTISEAVDFNVVVLRLSSGAPSQAIAITYWLGAFEGSTKRYVKIPYPLAAPDNASRLVAGEPVILGKSSYYTQHALVESTKPTRNGQVQVIAWNYDARTYNRLPYTDPEGDWEGYINYTFNAATAALSVTWPAYTGASHYAVTISFYPQGGFFDDVREAYNGTTTATGVTSAAMRGTGNWLIRVVAHVGTRRLEKVRNTPLLTYNAPSTEVQWPPSSELEGRWITLPDSSGFIFARANNATEYSYSIHGWGKLSDPAIDDGFPFDTSDAYTVQGGVIPQFSQSILSVLLTATRISAGGATWSLGGGRSYELAYTQMIISVTARNATSSITKTN